MINLVLKILTLCLLTVSVSTLARTEPSTNSATAPKSEPSSRIKLQTKSRIAPVIRPRENKTVIEKSTLPQLLSSKRLYRAKTASEKKYLILNEWLVSSVSLEQANREKKYLAEFKVKIKRRQWLPRLGFMVSVYRLPMDADPFELYEQVRRQHPHLQIEFNQRYPLQSANNADFLNNAKSYGHNMVGILKKGCAQFEGKIAMMDSKVNDTLPLFKGGFLEAYDLPQVKQGEFADHGTGVAALIHGLLPQAQLLAINVYAEKDGELETRSDWLLSGFETVLNHNPLPVVLNMSFGGNSSQLLGRAMEQLDKQGIRLVAAAGNGGLQAKPVFPAAYKSVRAVSALDVNEKLWLGSNRGSYIDYAAPGVDIWRVNAKGEGSFKSGTSFAAPWVTVAAALASKEQWDKPASLARDLGKLGRDSQYGYGLIQLAKLCRK